MRFITVIFVTIFIFFILIGCSSRSENPVDVSKDGASGNPLIADSSSNGNGHELVGLWDATFDPENLTAEISPVRDMSGHINVTSFLPRPSIRINSYDAVTEVIDVDVTISNPSQIEGYDVRLIIYTDNAGHLLLNDDGWFEMFDIAGGQNMNPFKAYAKDQQFRIFQPQSQNTENLQILMPLGNFNVRFAVEASYPWNCREPYEITEFTQTKKLYSTAGYSAPIQVKVSDWQSDVDSVLIFAPEITGEAETSLTDKGNFIWGTDLVNNMAAPAGDYNVLIKGTSVDPFGAYHLYDYVTLTITEASEMVDWTFLVYMHESNLGAYALQNMNAMENAGSLDYETNIIVLWDKTDTADDVILRIAKDPGGYNPAIISPEIDDHGEVIPPGGLDMGSQTTLTKFLRWSVANYPAKHYGLVLWDHGDGPFSIIPEDNLVRSCCNGLQIWEIRDACTTVLNENPNIGKMGFVGFDACLMGWIETAYCLRNVADVVVASEMLEPGDGWSYNPPLTLMRNQSDTLTSEQLTASIVNSYISAGGADKTLSAVRASDLVNNVIPALDNLASLLMDNISGYRNTISSCRTNTGKWGDSCNESYCKDLGYMSQIMSSASLPANIKDAASTLNLEIENSMVVHGHTGSGSNGCPFNESGLQIWFPSAYNNSTNDTKRADYVNLEFTDTLWDDFLNSYD